jgi:glycosyltransferase involved in cell wall biosynthesis
LGNDYSKKKASDIKPAMSSRPFFTIGVPTFNRAEFVSQAIPSALQQTCTDLELLVSDNASPDNTRETVLSFKDPRLQYFRQDSNIGSARNANFLVEKARGDYFVMLQDDDLLHPEFLARCRRNIGERKDVAIYTGVVLSGPSPKGILGLDLQYRESPMQPLNCVSDAATEISGVDAAIMQLFILPFVHPGIALRSEFLRMTGGLFAEFGFAGDNLTLARVGLRGVVLYDFHVAAFQRMHGQNFSVAMSRRNKLASRRDANERIIGYLNATAPDWKTRAAACVKHLSGNKRWKLLAETWEGNYPALQRHILLESLAGKSAASQLLCNLGVLALKADLRHVLLNRWRALQPI